MTELEKMALRNLALQACAAIRHHADAISRPGRWQADQASVEIAVETAYAMGLERAEAASDIEPLLRECREALKFVPLRWNEKQREALVAKLTALLGDTEKVKG